MMAMDDVKLTFEEDALRAIAKEALRRNTGARGLRSIIEHIMLNVMFDAPSADNLKECIITADCVTKGAEPTLIREDAE